MAATEIQTFIDFKKLEEFLDESVECPLQEFFAPDIYVRQVTMPAGTFVLGATHLTEHLNVVISGAARVVMDGEVVEIKAPCTFKSNAGVQKILHVTEDCIWQTVHSNPDNCTDTSKLEERLVDYTRGEQVSLDELEKLTWHLLQQP